MPKQKKSDTYNGMVYYSSGKTEEVISYAYDPMTLRYAVRTVNGHIFKVDQEKIYRISSGRYGIEMDDAIGIDKIILCMEGQ